ncbi:MAG TPA: bacitracin ABC transporter ATP-binding protein [Terrisporobacter glycolicus]|uniref:Bacitracin export ATP-binding protein BceA n=1 Tax=Terrisporobacter petrolearius TaxID=1460447 RepID=A0ABZ3F991_9FIRM|nr:MULTISPECIES: ABC transporter ATP-binding protein [Terrisporobacter]MBN9648237.1 ABC transporter ATP-binding protein [Terrisporobacter glycolicus]HBI93421.1 bacitracin ABC transporter ATP-binding protein [Terrisporobacter hibernicus]
MLKTINLKKDIKNNKNTFKILKDINLEVKEGEFLSVMGPSGAGKTTLLNILSTVDKPTSGNVYYENKDISKMNNKELSKFRRDNIGFIFQDYNLLDSMSVEDNIALPLVIGNEKQSKIKEEVVRLAKFFGIEAHVKKYPYELSGGQKQRAAAARALITSPKIIFADEPTGALDSKSSSELLNCLKDMNEKFNVTVIMVTHDPFSASYSKKVIFMKDGKLNARIDSSGNRKEFYNSIMNLLTSMGGEVNELL